MHSVVKGSVRPQTIPLFWWIKKRNLPYVRQHGVGKPGAQGGYSSFQPASSHCSAASFSKAQPFDRNRLKDKASLYSKGRWGCGNLQLRGYMSARLWRFWPTVYLKQTPFSSRCEVERTMTECDCCSSRLRNRLLVPSLVCHEYCSHKFAN